MYEELILRIVVSKFIENAKRDSYNGVLATLILQDSDDEDNFRSSLSKLVKAGKVSCVFSSVDVNIHIKRLPDFPVAEQLKFIETESPGGTCIYPSASEVSRNLDVSQWDDRPFTKSLVLAEPQLTYRAFELPVLERYAHDPRYLFEFHD